VLLPQLRRVRWAVRATLVLGVAASVVANILHALDNPISQAIAAWPPLALLLTVELISRVPVHRRSLAFARLFATATIAGIAAWVSYWHMAGVAARYGESGASPYLLPLSVDGLIVVASICLVELGGRIATLENEAAATTRASREAAESAAQVAAAARHAATTNAIAANGIAVNGITANGITANGIAVNGIAVNGIAANGIAANGIADRPVVADPVPARAGGRVDGRVPGLIPVPSPTGARRSPATAAALAEVAAALPRTGLPKTRGAEVSAFTPTLTRQGRVTVSAATNGNASPAKATTTARSGSPNAKAAKQPATAARNVAKPTSKTRRSPAETLAAAAKIKATHPDITETDLATRLGISASRWRTIRREADQEGLRLAA